MTRAQGNFPTSAPLDGKKWGTHTQQLPTGHNTLCQVLRTPPFLRVQQERKASALCAISRTCQSDRNKLRPNNIKRTAMQEHSFSSRMGIPGIMKQHNARKQHLLTKHADTLFSMDRTHPPPQACCSCSRPWGGVTHPDHTHPPPQACCSCSRPWRGE